MTGLTSELLTLAADVVLEEARRLALAVRETPFQAVHALRAILLLLLVSGASGATPGEVCHLDGVGDWGPIDTYTGALGGCSDLGGDDHVVVDPGAVVRTVDDLVMDGATPGLQIVVQGTWILDSADRRGGPGPLRVAVNGNLSAGVVAFDGAHVVALGRVLAWGVDHSAAPVYREAPDLAPGSFASVSGVVPCTDLDGNEDCAASGTGRPERLRILGPEGDPLWTSYLARITPAHRLCFFTPDDRRFSPPAQAGFCFEIVEVGTAYLDLDVRRSGGTDEAPYRDALRQHAAAVLDAPVAAGERCFTTDDVISADGERVGQWVSFVAAGGPGAPLLVSVAEDEVAPGRDRFCVADRGGLPQAHPPGERLWFGWGIEPGDPFYVDAPIVFESATGGDCDAGVRLSGELSLRGVSFRRQRSVSIVGAATTLSDCERLWVYGKRDPRGAQILWQGLDAVSCRWVAATTAGDAMPHCVNGGPALATDVHGLQCDNCRSFDLRDVGSAFGVDDLVYASVSGGAPAPELVTGARWNLGPMGTPAFSGQVFENLGAQNVALSDVACLRCTSCDGLGALFFTPTAPTTELWQVDRLSAVGTCGGLGIASLDSELAVRDVTFLDGRDLSGMLLPNRVERGVFRGSRGLGTAKLASHGQRREDLWIHDQDFGAPEFWSLQAGEQIENVLVADAQCSARSGAGGCVLLGDAGVPADDLVVRDLTLARTPAFGSLGPTHQLRLASAALGVRAGGLLFLGFGGPDAVAASDFGNATLMADPARFTWEAPICHWENVPAGPAADNAAAYASAAVPGVFTDPELADWTVGDLEPLPGGTADTAPCGIARGTAGPGVRARSWSLGLLDLEPEFVGGTLAACGNGLDDDGDGWIDHEDPGCTDARDASERAPRPCGVGAELAPCLVALAALRERRRRARRR